jgi:hypothetical protein
MTNEQFQYILSKQQEWAILYKKQQAEYKLEKNRKEKAKVKLLSQSNTNEFQTRRLYDTQNCVGGNQGLNTKK